MLFFKFHHMNLNGTMGHRWPKTFDLILYIKTLIALKNFYTTFLVYLYIITTYKNNTPRSIHFFITIAILKNIKNIGCLIKLNIKFLSSIGRKIFYKIFSRFKSFSNSSFPNIILNGQPSLSVCKIFRLTCLFLLYNWQR